MDVLMGLLTITSVGGIAVGLVMCVFQQLRDRGKQIAFYGVVGFAFIFTFALFQGPKTSVQAAAVQPVVKTDGPPSYKDVLGRLKVDSLTWEKDGFGTVMKASFVIRNNSTVDVKDIVVTCKHSSNSGTNIDSNTRTVYEKVPHNSYQAVIGFNMGFIHSAVSRSACSVDAYSPA
ncbi:hypothetical protein JQ580_25910 [Bradyrhizobium japonicum]|uniref:hypothetical protein n=1 Tax=Bradyrhizobium japonicum TaxID=375 RepID=UPI001BA5BD12|nr:hypothetical protein [Bradyrhizobium japonicum]MBR0994162.1 hypothetical protein [Bradyrhizobium japonicum]